MIDIKPIKYLLWDVDLERFDAQKYQLFLADRIAEKGGVAELKWYFGNFGQAQFLERVEQSRNVSGQTKNFWRLYQQHNQLNTFAS